MVLGLVALAAFYTWRFTVWAGQAGGYWNLMTGRTATPKSSVADTAAYAASAASSAKSGAKVAVSFHSLPLAVKLTSRPAQSEKDQPSSPVKEMSSLKSSNSPTRSVSSPLSYLPLFDH
jgi:hypothetical protein